MRMKFLLGLGLILFAVTASSFGQGVKFGERTTPLPFTIANNLVVVKASIGTGADGWFVFDTGAESTVVDAKYATSTGLIQSGKTTGTGSAGTAVAGVIKGAKVKIGNLIATDLTVYSIPLDFLSAGLGIRIAGIIGNDIIGKAVAEIDYAGKRLTLYRPADFRTPASAEVVPLKMRDELPFVETPVSIGGKTVTAKLEIDTGSTGSVLFNAPFVRKHRLTRSLGRTMASRTGGVGGTGASQVARVDSLRFGKTAIAGPLAVLYTGTKGDNASSAYDGLLGGAIFRRFKMTIDITGKRLFLEPTASVNDPFETDMSGMDLLADGDDLSKILVDEVKPASVAAKAGVRGGDSVRSVNGRLASEIGLQEIRKMFRTPGEYDVELTRARRVFKVHLVLQRVI